MPHQTEPIGTCDIQLLAYKHISSVTDVHPFTRSHLDKHPIHGVWQACLWSLSYSLPKGQKRKKTMNKTKPSPSLPPAKTLSAISRNHISSLKRKRVKKWSEKSLHGSKLRFQMHQTIVSKQRTHDWITLHRCSSQRASVTLKEQRSGLHLRSHRRERPRHLNTCLSPSLISNQSGDRLKDTQIRWSSHSASDR